MELQENWKLRDFDVGEARDLEVASPEYIDYFWMTAKVPGDVHSTLIERGIIADPFYGHNDQQSRWVEDKVWWYRNTFEWFGEQDDQERIELVFDGLDTYATVYLNGVELDSTDNMFIAHSFEVTRELKKGKNVLAVKIDPVHLHAQAKMQYYWSGFSKKRIWTRKAQYHYGWDWGPRLVCAGIWKGVHLLKRRNAYIDSVFARTSTITDKAAAVEVTVDVLSFNKDKPCSAYVELIDTENNRVASEIIPFDRCNGLVQDGAICAYSLSSEACLNISNPSLWWTHDLGVPYLYHLKVTLLYNEKSVDVHEQPFGIRTVELMQRDEHGQQTFTFVLNGIKLFAKGANWIPIDSFMAAVPDSRYQHLIHMSKDANMNMLRVWGGGIYERDIFYDECDRLGLLVWQDFMFACALYPDYNRNFMNNVRREIEQVVKRLRSRTCLALWCGNNENDWLYEALRSSGEIPHPFYGEKIYHELMPALLETLDPTRTFWPSSPYGGNDHNSREEGDTHNWQVWHGNIEPREFGQPQLQDYSMDGLSFKKFKGDTTRFASEFGMHASSNRYTLQRNIPENQFFWGSDEMKYRNKDIHHAKGILLMEGFTGAPGNIEEYLDYSMLTQAEGLKYGIEHYRRNKPETSGALFWQLNDCWPGTSWSVIDYYGLAKAAYHYARKFFAPVLITADHDAGKDLILWVINDRLDDYKDTVRLTVYRMDGSVLSIQEFDVSVPANSKLQIAALTEMELTAEANAADVVCVASSASSITEDNFIYLRDYKDMRFNPAQLRVSVDKSADLVRISTDQAARMVKLELDEEWLVMNDNFFDLLPGQIKEIQVKQVNGKTIPWETLRVSALNTNGDSITRF
ncbi:MULTISPECIES: beta-mannosidase [unclassified Paenibacillus]|uniref:beta-mannosidase n=1 Tax=unclassified Paenibacillus TaxID=185978 RepID=UPI000839B968|nr:MULTISPECIES: glycoside hydrolase family 2 protein [unclassified Paenibacillus]NWL88507.1 glycoside hydrolase family 2 protein [Paenibacillus sp. 79R4]